jgi:predicted porin
MKKLLIASAALAMVAGTAQAQSSVTAYGLLDQSYVKTDSNALATDAVTKATNTGGDGQLSGSRLGFRGTEDLGGGLKANFVLEMGVSASEAYNGSSFGTRLGFVELQDNNMGSVRLGRQVSPTKFINDAYTTFANSTWAVGSVVGGTETADTTSVFTTSNGGDRVGNAITYLSPVVSGFQVQLQTAKETSVVDGVEDTRAASATSVVAGSQLTAQTTNTNYGISYNAGPFSVMIGRADQDAIASNAVTNTQHDAIGLSYKMGAATLFAVVNDKAVKLAGVTQNERKDTTIGINYAMGKWDLKLAYSEGEVDQQVAVGSSPAANTGATVGKRDIKGYQIGGVYNFSKRTNAYVAYGDSETKTSGTNFTATRDGYIAGVRHSF